MSRLLLLLALGLLASSFVQASPASDLDVDQINQIREVAEMLEAAESDEGDLDLDHDDDGDAGGNDVLLSAMRDEDGDDQELSDADLMHLAAVSKRSPWFRRAIRRVGRFVRRTVKRVRKVRGKVRGWIRRNNIPGHIGRIGKIASWFGKKRR